MCNIPHKVLAGVRAGARESKRKGHARKGSTINLVADVRKHIEDPENLLEEVYDRNASEYNAKSACDLAAIAKRCTEQYAGNRCVVADVEHQLHELAGRPEFCTFDVTFEKAGSLGFSFILVNQRRQCYQVDSVVPGSHAESQGVQPRDIILSAGTDQSDECSSWPDKAALKRYLTATRPLKVTFRRRGLSPAGTESWWV